MIIIQLRYVITAKFIYITDKFSKNFEVFRLCGEYELNLNKIGG